MTEPFHVFVIGASAGGVETLIRLCELLPGDLPAAVFVVLHTPPTGPGLLPLILNRHGKLPALYPKNGEGIIPGNIYVAPPDEHMRVHKGYVELWHGPKINLLRPAADVTFSSAAHAYGSLCTGIVLSGTRNDGTAGLQSIKERGGVTIAQDPDEAIFSPMPQSAIEAHVVDYVLTISEIAKKIQEIARNPLGIQPEAQDQPNDQKPSKKEAVEDTMEYSKRVLNQDRQKFEKDGLTDNTRTPLTCPECGGVLVETHNGKITRYECQIGHGFSESSFMAGHSDMVEHALWAAIRALDERVLLLERMSNRAKLRGAALTETRFRDSADEARRDADLIRKIVSNGKAITNQDFMPDNDEEGAQ